MPVYLALKRFAPNRSGTSAVETALVMPAMVAMLFGVIQLGYAGFTYSAMLSGARTGARQMSFGMNGASAVSAVRAQMPAWVRAQANIVTTEDQDGMARVEISVPGDAASLIPFLPMPSSLDVDVTMPRVADR